MKTKAKPNKKRVAFTLHAPNAAAVFVAGSFCDWELGAIPLKKQKSGLWKTTTSLEPGTYHYRFIVDGAWADDPECSRKEANPFGSEDCILEV
jgi:1,4-alpha-glucan branching enzyme